MARRRGFVRRHRPTVRGTVHRARSVRLPSQPQALRDAEALVTRAAIQTVLDRGTSASVASRASLWSLLSNRSAFSVLSAWSLLSVASACSFASTGSLLSVGSAGSILSLNSAGSVLSVGSTGSVLGFFKAGHLPRVHPVERDSQPSPAAVHRLSGLLAVAALASAWRRPAA